MRVLFLLAVYIPFIFTVQAQKGENRFICQLNHQHHQKGFYLSSGETKKIKLGEWTLFATLREEDEKVKVYLRRMISVLDANYQKEASEIYPSERGRFPVKLAHRFGGKEDIFKMVCYSRED